MDQSDDKPKTLYRSRRNQVVSGVAGGLGKYFDIDPVLVRIGFVLLAFAHGVGILLYIVLTIILPIEDEKVDTNKHSQPQNLASEIREGVESVSNNIRQRGLSRGSGRDVVGVVIVIVGLLLLLNQLIPSFDFDLFWPALLILLGLFILMKRD